MEVGEAINHVEVDQKLFTEMIKEKRFQELLSDLDIAEEDQIDLFDTLDVDGGGIDRGTRTSYKYLQPTESLRDKLHWDRGHANLEAHQH
jgi:hypothetical protein